MSLIKTVNNLFIDVDLPDSNSMPKEEICRAAIYVAILNGITSVLLVDRLEITKQDHHIKLLLIGITSFAINWIVCKHAFPETHKYFGPKSKYHRLYDLIGVVSALGFNWFLESRHSTKYVMI